MKKLSVRSQRVFGLVIILAVIIGLIFLASALAAASWAPPLAHAEEPGSPGGTDDSASAFPSASEYIYSAHLPDKSNLAASEGSSDIPESDGLAMEPSELRAGWNAQLTDVGPAPLPRASLAPNPADTVEMVYATVSADVYRSPFAPASWSYVGTSPTTFCWIDRHPHGSHIYAVAGMCGPGAYNNLFRSADWGATWSVVKAMATSFALHPDDPDILYVGVGGWPTEDRGIWKTTDGGVSWTQIWHRDYEVPLSIGVSPVDPDLMFAGVNQNPDAAYSDTWIYRSTNGGSSWSRVYTVHTGTGPPASHVLPDRRDANKAYIALYTWKEDAGVLLTTNKGDSWTRVTNFGDTSQKCTWMLAQSPTDLDTLYKTGGTGHNIWRSTNGGYNWTQIDTGISTGAAPFWVAVSERSPDVVFMATDWYGTPRVYKSTNGGDTWSDFGSGQITGSGAARTLLLLETEGPSHYFGVCPSVGQCGDPVNTSTGNFAHEWQDLSIPGPGSSLLVQRTYNSQDSYEGPLGTGWSPSYDMRLMITDTDVVEMKVEDGRRDRYISSDGENFISPPAVNATFVRNTDETYTLTRQDQTRHNFSEEGLLTSIVTSNELTTTLVYDGNRLTNVTDPTGRTISFTWNVTNTRITGVEDPVARTIDYGYQDGDLTSVTDLRGYAATYAYTGTNGELSSFTDPGQSTPSVVNEYDAQGRVTSQWQAGSTQPMTFSYDPDNTQTTVTDARGHSQDHTYSLQLPLTDRQDSYGNTVNLTHNANNDLTSVTDERGNKTIYAYDTGGNVTSIVDAVGNEQSMDYDGHNNLIQITDAKDVPTHYQYDEHDNLTAIVQTLDGNPITTTFTYYADGVRAGLLKSRTDPGANTTLHDYDSYGNMTVITDSLGNVTTYAYDLAGRRTTETSLKDGQPHTIYYTYDDADNLTLITQTVDSEVVSTAYGYDEPGNRISVTDANAIVTKYEYDDLNRLVKMIQNYQEGQPQTNEINVETTYEYDDVGNRIKVIDANGVVTKHEYDDLNRLAKMIQNYQEGQPKTNEVNVETSYQYDEAGNQTQVTDPDGNTTYYGYDELNRLTTVTDPLSGATAYGYDPWATGSASPTPGATPPATSTTI